MPMPNGNTSAINTRESRIASLRSLRRIVKIMRGCMQPYSVTINVSQRPARQGNEHVLQRSFLGMNRKHLAGVHPGGETGRVVRIVEADFMLVTALQEHRCRAVTISQLELAGSVEGDDLAGAQKGNPMTELVRFLHRVGCEKDR